MWEYLGIPVFKAIVALTYSHICDWGNMNIELEYSPIEYINYKPVSKALAVSDQKRRNQRRFLLKHSSKNENEDSSANAQDFISNDEKTKGNEIFEPRKLFMKSRCFTHVGGNHSIFIYLDQIIESCYYHHSAKFVTQEKSNQGNLINRR